MKFFPTGQLNSPNSDTDLWLPKGTDSATQSACGIPDNAFTISKVAIHPYFLKYADLSRNLEDLTLMKTSESLTLFDGMARLLHARCLYLLLEGGRQFRHDAQSHVRHFPRFTPSLLHSGFVSTCRNAKPRNILGTFAPLTPMIPLTAQHRPTSRLIGPRPISWRRFQPPQRVTSIPRRFGGSS